MAEYHVGAGAFGIYCGILNKPAKDGTITWRERSVQTKLFVLFATFCCSKPK